MSKKFLDQAGLSYFASKYPDNEVLETVVNVIGDELDGKSDINHTHTPSSIGALPNNTTYVSTFNGQSGAITYTAPVTSVNGKTGAVTVTEYDDTALANRVAVLENIPWVTYYTGSSSPSGSLGSNGDLYLQTI